MGRILLTLAAFGALTLALAACDEAQTGASTSPTVAAPTGGTGMATPSDGIVTSEEVTVQGTVSMTLDDRAFLLTDPVLTEGTASDLGNEIVVVVTGDPISIGQSDQVVVRGTLHRAEVGDELTSLEDQLNVDLPEAIASVISGTQLLLADSVEAS